MNTSSLAPTIIFEDDAIIVVDKPAGLIVNRADTTTGIPTLQEWIEARYNITPVLATSDPSIHDFYKRSGIVHRLDKMTSGVLIVAKTQDAFEKLQAQFKEKTVQKTYTALTHGKVIPEEGEINAPIGRLPWNRMRFGILPEGREALTLYKVDSYLKIRDEKEPNVYTLVKAFPRTGRTHQIRVHFLYLGFPLFSDELYVGRKNYKHDKKYLIRHFLHASTIRFSHPTSGEELEFTSPLPSDLQTLLDQMEKTN